MKNKTKKIRQNKNKFPLSNIKRFKGLSNKVIKMYIKSGLLLNEFLIRKDEIKQLKKYMNINII